MEFGHRAVAGAGFRMDSWGAGPFVIRDAGGRLWRFEDSDRFGPSILNLNGEVKARQPGSRSAFWRPHFLWRQQGRHLADDGVTCIWREPRPTLVRVVGHELVVVEAGESDGQHICVDAEGNRIGVLDI